MATAIAPYERITDVIVNMKVQQPIPEVGFGNLLLLNEVTADNSAGVPNSATALEGLLKTITDSTTGAVYKEYGSMDAISLDYDSQSATYAKANSYFAQDAASDRIAILSYPTGKLEESLGAFWFQNWYFMAFVDTTNTDDVTLASNICEVNALKFLFVQKEKVEDHAAWEGNGYTVDLIQPLEDAMDTGFIGSVASKTVGSQTWKFKKINGITPHDYSSTDFATINLHHAIAYVTVNSVEQTSEGWTSNGEYIDSLHGDTWVKVSVQANVQTLFQENPKIPYEKSGIDLITSVVFNTLTTAWEQGIILTDDATKQGDFSVAATERDAQSLSDLSKRHYGGISFTYHRSGAIHSATINGLVVSDTITTPKAATTSTASSQQ